MSELLELAIQAHGSLDCWRAVKTIDARISLTGGLSYTHLEETSMAAPQQYDAVVIGAGQAGGRLARALAQPGRTTALIEREHVGGTCVNEGCTPTKTMIAFAHIEES